MKSIASDDQHGIRENAVGFEALNYVAIFRDGMGVSSMKSVRAQAQTLAKGYVPESQIAGDLDIPNNKLKIR